MTIENMVSYLKKLANIRNHVSRIGQFETPFAIHFRPPEVHESELAKMKKTSWTKKAQAMIKNKTRHKYEKRNVICIMCDGEFYEIKDPKTIEFKLYDQIWTLGRNEKEKQGRLVKDELDTKQDQQ